MRTDQLRPWESLPAVACERCDRQATWRVTAGTATIKDNAVYLGGDPLTASALACDDHSDDLAEEFCDRYDGSMGEPLRMSWRVWFFTQTWLGRPFDRLSVAWWNWRFERGVRRSSG